MGLKRRKYKSIFVDATDYEMLKNYIKDFIDEEIGKGIPRDYFTAHDSSHCQAVENLIRDLVFKSDIELSELEDFLLYASAWTHDIGMSEKIAKDYFEKVNGKYSRIGARKIHEKIAAWYLSNNEDFQNIFINNDIPESTFRAWINTLNIIIRYHRRANDISKCPMYRRLREDQIINLRLLACLLRLGDTLHVDSSRFDKRLYDIFQIGDFDRTARLHWLKSYLVSAVNLNINNQTINITIDLPELESGLWSDAEDLNYNKLVMEESIERLKFFIYEDIYEDLESVSDTFQKYEYPFYTSIKIDTNFIPGFQDGIKEEVASILNDMNIISAPNSSNVIEKSLRSIDSLYKMKSDSYEIFDKNFSQLLDNLRRIHETRPCHVGLKTIISKLEEYYKNFPKADLGNIGLDKKDELMIPILNEMRDINEKRKTAKGEINRRSTEELDNKRNIFLFGFSQMAIDFLCANRVENFRECVNLYVFECASKRKLSITNKIEYNDGIHYALELSKHRFNNIKLLPETSFPSLIKDGNLNINGDNSLLLLGANGIDLEGNCGHTSGHLLMVIVAQHLGIPIYVVADKFKIGIIEWNPSLKREGFNWLSGKKELLRNLESKNIQLINYREDKIPLTDITDLIMDSNLNKESFPLTEEKLAKLDKNTVI